MKILLIHGPNLNLLGSREPDKYGSETVETILANLRSNFSKLSIDYFQSNSEGEIIDCIHNAKNSYNGILINAGGLSHTSISIADALRSIGIPTINIHITNIQQRESYRHTDIIGEACAGSIVGLGTDGYLIAMECLLDNLKI